MNKLLSKSLPCFQNGNASWEIIPSEILSFSRNVTKKFKYETMIYFHIEINTNNVNIFITMFFFTEYDETYTGWFPYKSFDSVYFHSILKYVSLFCLEVCLKLKTFYLHYLLRVQLLLSKIQDHAINHKGSWLGTFLDKRLDEQRKIY